MADEIVDPIVKGFKLLADSVMESDRGLLKLSEALVQRVLELERHVQDMQIVLYELQNRVDGLRAMFDTHFDDERIN